MTTTARPSHRQADIDSTESTSDQTVGEPSIDTASDPAVSMEVTCPLWCQNRTTGRCKSTAGDAHHQFEVKEAWGLADREYGEEKLFLSLEQFDGDACDVGNGADQARITVTYSEDGYAADGCVDLSVDTAVRFARAILWLTCTDRWLGRNPITGADHSDHNPS